MWDTPQATQGALRLIAILLERFVHLDLDC